MLLLTGATGFLGSRLCAELLRRTDQQVICLVRADSTEDAERRVRDRLSAQDPGQARSHRLRFVAGDVALPRFGLARDLYDALDIEVTDVYHCAASVNMAGSYRRLAEVNEGDPKRLHHISTLSVFLAARRAGWDRVPEHAMPTPRTCGDFGYPRSKCDAELLVAAHALRGLPATVYRPGLVLADSRDGAAPHDDFIACLIAAAIATGRFPETDSPLPVIAVDHAAQMIAALSTVARTRPGLDVHPVIRPEPLLARELARHLRARGYDVTAATETEWLAALRGQGRNRYAQAMRALTISRHLLGLSPDTRLPELDCTETAKSCAGAGIVSPAMDRAYFSRALRHLSEHGVIPQPTQQTRSLR